MSSIEEFAKLIFAVIIRPIFGEADDASGWF